MQEYTSTAFRPKIVPEYYTVTSSILIDNSSTLFRFTSTPIPALSVSTAIRPSSIFHSDTTISLSQYRLLGEISPGMVKFGSDASATLCARPTPLSSIPPHQTGMLCFMQRSWIAQTLNSISTIFNDALNALDSHYQFVYSNNT